MNIEIWGKYTDATPYKAKIRFFVWISRLFGLTFGIKLMKRTESKAQDAYEKVCAIIPEAGRVIHDESKHEKAMLSLLDEERLRYVGSIVLGLNDSLVELTGALAGLTLSLARPNSWRDRSDYRHCRLVVHGCLGISLHPNRRNGSESAQGLTL